MTEPDQVTGAEQSRASSRAPGLPLSLVCLAPLLPRRLRPPELRPMETNIPPPPTSAVAGTSALLTPTQMTRRRRRSPPMSAPAELLDLASIGPNVDAPALRFLALHSNRRRRRRTSTSFANPLLQYQLPPPRPEGPHHRSHSAGSHKDDSSNKTPSPVAAIDHKLLLNLSARPAMPMAHDGSPAPGPALANKKRKQQGDGMDNAAAIEQEEEADFAVKAANAVSNSALPIKKKMKNAAQKQHFRNPAALQAAYSCAETLGTFGPPSATPLLQDLPPITLNAPPPVPKLPLTDIRKNLETMISSLTRRSSSFNSPEEAKPAVGSLVGEMQGLLAKVDKMLQGASSSTAHRY
ncbi:uncharacterized protein LOC133884425 [Phragmites australis]|uniref:uncharacterized protein LOC133884425 n=1 Tax=Phragmites australis TaxID=29695 RepID=UPI002D7920FC|nr:uncharacterized protein LOC133884425 [Phragmites australis]